MSLGTKILNIKEILDAVNKRRNFAIISHPDAGGSTDQMRKLNEAYQLLKNLYRN